MRLLIDTNCWIQILRDREHSQEVRQLLADIADDQLFITDLSLHSVGIVMSRFKMLNQFPAFMKTSGIGTTIRVIGLAHTALYPVINFSGQLGLDFEDAYQYAIAEMYKLKL